MKVKIFDNGRGMSAKALDAMNDVLKSESDMFEDSKKHIGLLNIQKRLRICYGDGYGINVKSWQGKGTVLILKLPKIGGSNDV